MPTLQFKGKTSIWNHHLSIPYHTLDEVKELHYSSVGTGSPTDTSTSSVSGNLIIEGDNLLALKALLPQYAGRVKCIYIDPPYNTGNEHWVYNDNVNSPLVKEWLGKEVGKDDLTRHDKWLCMMVPRLKLLRELLSDDGVIFISIDDNEQHNLRLIMDEVFGEENFINIVSVLSKVAAGASGGGEDKRLKKSTEYLILYSRNYEKFRGFFNSYKEEPLLSMIEEMRNDDQSWKYTSILIETGERAFLKTIKDGSDDDIDIFKTKIIKRSTIPKIMKEENLNEEQVYLKYFEKIFSDTNAQSSIRARIIEACPNLGENELYEVEYVPKSGRDAGKKVKHCYIANTIRRMIWLSDVAKKENNAIWKKERLGTLWSEISYNNVSKEGETLFENGKKPIALIEECIRSMNDVEMVILDSFAGSGTTMHAMMELNKEDGGTRKCIMIQMTEANASEPKKNICKDITRERVKRAIEKFGYDSGFQYLRVGRAIDPENILSGDLPFYEEFAKYVYYLCTGEYHKNDKEIKADKYFVGKSGSYAIYLVYKPDFEEMTRLALNLTLAEKMKKDHPNERLIVYAPACFLDEEYLEANQIEYVNIPYGMFGKVKK